MAYNIVANNGRVNYGVKHFVVDTIEDIKNLPSSQSGSTVYCFETGKKYILDNQGYWHEMAGSGSNGGQDEEQLIEQVYDGGVVGEDSNITSGILNYNGGDIRSIVK